jgi:hypothetical protein
VPRKSVRMGCLFCVECSTSGEKFERGWRGFLTDDEFEPTEVAILCPDCAEREFGPRATRPRRDEDYS